MRNDIKIDRKQVRCKKSSTLGFSKKTLRVGERFKFLDVSDGDVKVGRMIGRVASHAAGIGLEQDEVAGSIVAIVMALDLQSFQYRWVWPDNVISTVSDKGEYDNALEYVTEFLTLDIKKHDPRKLVAFLESGYSTVEKFDARHKSTHLAEY